MGDTRNGLSNAENLSELSLERVSLHSTTNCESRNDQHSRPRSTHSDVTESCATQVHEATQSEESQPLSSKPPSLVDGSDPSSTKKPKRPYWRIWWLEVLSSLLALSCLIAMVSILAIHQGEPLPNWPDLISVNSLISIFTAVFKASLIMPIAEGLGQLKWEWFRRPRSLRDIEVFDSASRGPWGSILLIVGQIPRSEKAFLAGLGAFVTILALAVDPFSQAMIQLRPCDRELVTDVPHVARTNIYDGRLLGGSEYSYGVDEAMTAAIYRGLIDPQETSALVDFKCATGNCTFGQQSDGAFFSSLALCHSCHDISDKITSNGSRAWQLHMGQRVNSWPGDMAYVARATHGRRRDRQSRNASTGLHDDRPSPSFFSFDALTLFAANGTNIASDGIQPFAVRCSLDPCVKTYHGEVHNGIYKETEYNAPGEKLKKFPGMYSDIGRRQDEFALATKSTIIDGVEHPCPGSPRQAPGTVPFNEKEGSAPNFRVGSPGFGWEYYPRECIWAVDMESWFGMSDTLEDLLLGNVTQAGTDAGLGTVKGPIWPKRIFAGGYCNVSTAEEVVAGVAHSITAAMRNLPFGKSGKTSDHPPTYLVRASGKAFTTDTCIDVAWGWLAYPVALLVLQWIFSALVLLTGWKVGKRGEERTVWKTSPIPLLFHGLDEELRQKNGELMSLKEMEGVSGELKVQLAPADEQARKGWRFCET